MTRAGVALKTWPHRYPALLERDPERGTWAGFLPGLPVFAWGKGSREEVLESLSRGLSLYLLELEGEGKPLPPPHGEVPPEVLRGTPGGEVVYLSPAPVNPVSLELARALRVRGLSRRELARRMGTSPAAVLRLLDPFYFGHTLESLRRAAEALGAELEVRLSV